MNELIELLAEQCYEHDQSWTGGGQRIFNKEKFAELIVKECLGCCEQVISDPVPESVDTWLNGGSQCIDEIREHFGVEG